MERKEDILPNMKDERTADENRRMTRSGAESGR
jgi:hypothetical protein